MKIVLYFSAAFGLFWLIHGVLSHRDPAKRYTIRHSNTNEDEGGHPSSESTSSKDNILIKSESPLRGRKIHQTAWSKEESDAENDDEMKQPDQKTTAFPGDPGTLQKILKYLTSLVYPLDGIVPSSILITSGVIDTSSQETTPDDTKVTQKSTRDDKSIDGFSENIQKNGRRVQPLTHTKSYLEDYYETVQTEDESDENLDSDESDENSSEYENSDEEDDDESQINYKTSTKKYWTVQSSNLFQGNKEPNQILKKLDRSSSIPDESMENEDCYEDTDLSWKQNSQENQKTKEVLLKDDISDTDDMEDVNEDSNYRRKQKAVSKEMYEGIKQMLRGRTEKGTEKTPHKITVLNGTKTGQNDKNKASEVTQGTSFANDGITKTTSRKIIVLNGTYTGQNDKNITNEVTQGTSFAKDGITKTTSRKIIVLNGTYTGQNDKNSTNEIPQGTTNVPKQKSKVILNTENIVNEKMSDVLSMDDTQKILSINEHQNFQVDSFKETIQNKSNDEIIQNTLASQNTRDEFTNSELKQSEQSKSDDTENNTTHSENNLKPANRQQEHKTSSAETMQTVPQNESMKTETVQNEETLSTSSINNIATLNLNENNATVLKNNLETLTDVKRQENIQATNNEEIINKVVETQTILMNNTELNNEEISNKVVETQTILMNKTELNNGKKKEFDAQNETDKLAMSEMQIVGENQNLSSQQQASQTFIAEDKQNNYELLMKNFNDQVKETLSISDDNGYEYILEGNEFVPHNEENYSGLLNNNMVFNNSESENKSQLLTESIASMLQNVQQIDSEAQEPYDTILEFLYKHSKNPLILSLKENSNATN